jgi:hypothetical protein
LEQLTASQIAEWEVYDSIDPIGDFRIEMSLAYGFSIIANLLIKAHFKKGKELKPIDFLIDWSGDLKQSEGKKQSVEEMKRFLLQFAKEQNRRVERECRKSSKR